MSAFSLRSIRAFQAGRFAQDEDGAGTVWGITWFMIMAGLAGLSIDVTDGFRARTMLQATADAAALAAVQDLPTADAVRATAINYGAANMSSDVYGSVVDADDVVVGDWDPATRSITPDDVTPTAVLVVAREDSSNGNSLAVTFLRIMGLQSWNVRAAAVAAKFIPECLNEGLIANNRVDLAANNDFVDNFCVNGFEGVDMQMGNTFEPGTTVGMEDLADLTVPGDNVESIDGLPEALAQTRLKSRMVNTIDELMADYLDPANSQYMPSYIDKTQAVIRPANMQTFNWATTQPGRVYSFKCANDRQSLNIPAGANLSQVVIIAECTINIGSGAAFQDVVIGSRAASNLLAAANPDRQREQAGIMSAADVRFGRDDSCAPGGGVQLLSNGSMSFAAGSEFYGAQLVAGTNINIAAKEDGIEGISAQAGNNISVTSNDSFGTCQTGVTVVHNVWYYRLVM